MSDIPELKKFEMPTEFKRDFKGIWIPKIIWLDKRLNFFEKLLLAEIDSLDGADHCYASNKYFSEFFNVRERTVQDALAHLKKLKYIEQVSFDGRIRKLKSNLKTTYEKFNTPDPQTEKVDMKNLTPLECENPHPSIIGESIEPDNKVYNKDIRERENTLPFRFKRVKMKKEAYDGLIKDFGESKIKEMLDRLDEYADINPKRFKQYANHSTVIRKWLREESGKASKTPQDRLSGTDVIRNRQMFGSAISRAPNGSYEVISDIKDSILLQISETKERIWVNFHASSFRDEANHFLRKMDLPLLGV